MNRGTYGMAAAKRGHDMSEGDWLNDTSKVKWSADLERDPKHVLIMENFRGGTKWTIPANTPTRYIETLYAIRHGMPFPPKFLCYFYARDAPSAQVGAVGQYMIGYAYMLTNAFPMGEEGIFCEVDDEWFYIKHYVETVAGNSANTFYGSDYNFRVRYMLLNQPALVKSTAPF